MFLHIKRVFGWLQMGGIAYQALLFLLCLMFAARVQGATYYVSVTGADTNNGLSVGTPWQTIERVNKSFSILKEGDAILFRRGDAFFGSIVVSKSGKAGAPITIGAYGKGPKPIVTGFTTLTNWTNEGGGIYSAQLAAPTVNMVTFDGAAKAMGRYPNNGYLKYEAHTSNVAITDNELNSSTNWTGAEVVIRKYRWILDRHVVTAHSGNTLTYNALATYGNNKAYSPVDGNGYFIQNDLRTLDQSGEWCFSPSLSRLYMFFGRSNPSSHVVKATSLDKNLSVSTHDYVTFSDLHFEGGNTQGAYLINCHHFMFTNCDFSFQGGNAIYGGTLGNITIFGGSISNSLNGAIWFEYDADNCLIEGVDINKTATFAGATRSGDGAGEGIEIKGNGTIIRRCRITETGYIGINFFGSDVLVEQNYVNTFCTIKDDGSGIYTYTGGSGAGTNRIVRDNIVLNGVGAFAGAESYFYEAFGKACGIYLDDKSQDVDVSGNTVANCAWAGIFVHGSADIRLSHNTLYNNLYQLFFEQYQGVAIRNITRSGNKFISRLQTQPTFFHHSFVNENASLTGSSDSNFYARPIDDEATIRISINGAGDTNISLASWQSDFGQDVHSHKAPKAISALTDLRFEYNATGKPTTTSLDDSYIDVEGKACSSTLVLQPYTSVVLIRNPNLKPVRK